MRRDRYPSETGLIRDSHTPVRGLLRVIGPTMVVVGLIFTAVGLVSFFSAFGSFGGPPRYFWCAFIGLPMTGLGVMITKFAFLGTIARYLASEAAPVGKDTFNYMADGTQDGVRTVARSVAAGLREGADPSRRADGGAVACPDCGEENDAGSKFCDQCGQTLPGENVCPSCQTRNDADARFCDACGKGFSR